LVLILVALAEVVARDRVRMEAVSMATLPAALSGRAHSVSQ